MSVDMYTICPCGNGKKIKFCKCRDSVGELDRVTKMMEGGQYVPALDRLSNILREHPDAAWAYAVRGRLLLSLREYETLAENAERFIRLQPSNPLALTQRAVAKLFRDDIDGGLDSLLEALTESGREIDSFVLDVASVFAVAFARIGNYLTSRVYATLPMMTTGYEGGAGSMQLLRQLNGSPSINQLLKWLPELIERSDEADWGERYDEAAGLLRNNKILLAQSKFESLRRVAGDEPAVLSGLLSCAIWRGNADQQADCLRALSGCEGLDLEQRHRYRAMSALVRPESPELSVESVVLTADVSDLEQVEMAMTAESRFVPLPREMMDGMRTEDQDVPPRAGFQLLDRDPPSADSLPSVDEVPGMLAVVLLFGKQTDRSACVEAYDVRRANVDEVRTRLSAVIEGAELTESADDSRPIPLLAACNTPVAMIRYQGNRADAEALQAEVEASRMPSMIASLPLGLLGGKSLIECVDDESAKFDRTAVMRVVENFDAIVARDESIITKVYELAKLEPLPPISLSNEQAETVANEDLNRIDPQGIDRPTLVYLLQRAQQVAATPAARRFAHQILESDIPEGDEASQQEAASARMFALVSLVQASTRISDALRWLEEAKGHAEKHGLPTADLLINELELRIQSGDPEGFQRAVETLTSRFGNDPEVMGQVQQMLIQYGFLRPDGSPQQGGPGGGAPVAAGNPAAMSPGGPGAGPGDGGGGSGLWTPDSPGGEPPAQGGGKLWVPGMD